jgi:hypothetical protein
VGKSELYHQSRDIKISSRKNVLRAMSFLPKIENPQAVINDYNSGLSSVLIAQKYGVTPDGIRKLMLRHGIPLRTQKKAGEVRTARRKNAERLSRQQALAAYHLLN